MNTNNDHLVVWAMNRYGGSFVQALARAAIHADDKNLAKIRATWPELWKEYGQMAEKYLTDEIKKEL